MKKTTLLLALSSLLLGTAHAGGILLHEVATFDSVSSAGVGNSSNRTDASAAITSPAGLTAIADSSWSLGLQYLDAYAEHNGTGIGINGPVARNGSGENKALVPSLAYAKRINPDWVLGASLHGDGGLGMEYTGGHIGYGLFDSMSQEALNVHLAAGYQATDKLSLGGALVIQHLMTTVDISSDLTAIGGPALRGQGEDNSTALSFTLSAMYDLSERTYLSANYKHRVDHRGNSLDIQLSPEELGSVTEAIDVIWPSRLDLGMQHQLTEQVTLKGMLGAEFWSDFDRDNRPNTNDVYSIGAAIAYQHNAWTYQAGARYDTPMYDSQDVSSDLAIGANWALGLGAETQRSNGHRFGLAYQYRDLGSHDVTYTLDDAGNVPYFTGRVENQRIHVLSLSYAY